MSRASVAGLGAAGVRRLLGDGFTHDFPGRITERLDVDVWVLDLTGDAYSIVADGRRVIVAKRTPNWFRQNFSIAHELGHLAADSLCDESLGMPATTRPLLTPLPQSS
ncbi:ImmA/IrrE family metallo-endopeptidase [Propioniciclava flava]